MSTHDDNVCGACGQRLGYKSSMSKGIVAVLKLVMQKVEEKGLNVVHIEKEMVQTSILTGNQGRNATHMVRLGLLAHIDGETGNYCLTRKAMEFLNGDPVPKWVEVSKRREGEGSRTVAHSDETCVVSDFAGKNEYWEVPGFEIKEGRIIKGNSRVVEL